MNAIGRRIVRTWVAVGAITLFVMTTASPATAASRDGVCDPGEFCLYWGPGQTGSVSDFTSSIPNYGATQPSCYEFKGPGAGQYECVKNNATSAWNRRSATVIVYFNSNYGGSSDPVTANQKRNLDNTYLENASHKY